MGLRPLWRSAQAHSMRQASFAHHHSRCAFGILANSARQFQSTVYGIADSATARTLGLFLIVAAVAAWERSARAASGGSYWRTVSNPARADSETTLVL